MERTFTIAVTPPGIPNTGPFKGYFTCDCGQKHEIKVLGYSHDLNHQIELFDYYGLPEGPVIRHVPERQGFEWEIHFPNDKPYIHLPTEEAARAFVTGWYKSRKIRTTQLDANDEVHPVTVEMDNTAPDTGDS